MMSSTSFRAVGRIRPVLLLLAVSTVAFLPARLAAQRSGSNTVGTILVAHGADSGWNARVEQIARMAHTGGPVTVAFLMGGAAKTHRFQDAAQTLVQAGVREIVVVPVLVSSHSGHYEQIRYLTGQTDTLSEMMRMHLHMAGIERPRVPVPLILTPALDDAPQMAHVLAHHALALATAPRAQALFLVGHGPNTPEDYAAWMKNLRVVADSVKAETGFRDVRVGVVRDDAPAAVRAEAVHHVRELISLQHALTGRPVVVVPVLISKGAVSEEHVPKDLTGLDIVYGHEPLLPNPEIAGWVESQVRRATAKTFRRAK